jgi:hypothetical protein
VITSKEQSMSKEARDPLAAPPARQAWKRPELKYVGNVGEVLQGGGGKLSTTTADKGDNGKPPGAG